MKSVTVCFASVAFGVFFSPVLMAMEHTKVLPAGVRKMTVRHVAASLAERTDAGGRKESLATPLEQNLTIADGLSSETGMALRESQAFLQQVGLAGSDPLGTFSADFAGSVQATAPILAWGLTDRITFGAAVPFYRARTDVSLGFQKHENADRFIAALQDPYANQTEKAREVASKLSRAPSELNAKLESNGYAPIGSWKDSGWGDTTLLLKGRVVETSRAQVAVTGGVVAPTGRADDPNILTDIPFGDGQWDGFSMVAVDQPLGLGFTANQYVQYTHQFAGKRDVRWQTDAEPIEVPVRESEFKLGDRYDIGASLQYDGTTGATGGLGLSYTRKWADAWRVDDAAVQRKLERDTEAVITEAEVIAGYSGVPAYQRGTLAVPFELVTSYKRQLASRNAPVRHLLQIDASVFF